MEVLIILSIITVLLNIVIYPLCKITYRIEDAEKIIDGKLRVKSETMYFPHSCWFISAVFLIIALFLQNNIGEIVVVLGIDCLVAFFLCLIALFKRNSYYTLDEERLSHVKHGNLEWSHTWDEIDHARKRVVSTGKAFIVYYDIVTKDGVKHRSLPSTLGRDLTEHVYIDKGANPWLITLILILLAIVVILIAIGIVSK